MYFVSPHYASKKNGTRIYYVDNGAAKHSDRVSRREWFSKLSIQKHVSIGSLKNITNIHSRIFLVFYLTCPVWNHIFISNVSNIFANELSLKAWINVISLCLIGPNIRLVSTVVAILLAIANLALINFWTIPAIMFHAIIYEPLSSSEADLRWTRNRKDF